MIVYLRRKLTLGLASIRISCFILITSDCAPKKSPMLEKRECRLFRGGYFDTDILNIDLVTRYRASRTLARMLFSLFSMRLADWFGFRHVTLISAAYNLSRTMHTMHEPVA